MKKSLLTLVLGAAALANAQIMAGIISAGGNAPQAAAPTFSPAGASQPVGTNITASTLTGGCTIYYGTSSPPTTAGAAGASTATWSLSGSGSVTYYAQAKACSGYGDSNIVPKTYTIAAGDTDVVTSFTHSGTVQTTNTCAGWSFNVFNTITVTKLWREKLSGDTGTKRLILRDNAGTDLGSCDVDTGTGADGDRQTCSLTTPQTLAATSQARIIQAPASGSFQYFNLSALTATADIGPASAVGGAYSGGACALGSAYDTANHSAGPIGFLYH